MITDINYKSIIKSLNIGKLKPYWDQYFLYEKDTALYSLTEAEFKKEIDKIKLNPRPYVDSQIVISEILTRLGKKHNFHRQFNENHPHLHKEQVLGMQLYKFLIDDSDTWIYNEIHPTGHMFPHATYFIKNEA